MIAGGYVPLEGLSDSEITTLEDRIIRKFMNRVGHKEISNFEKLVAPPKLVPETEVIKSTASENPCQNPL